jgi:hypothetical protein
VFFLVLLVYFVKDDGKHDANGDDGGADQSKV